MLCKECGIWYHYTVLIDNRHRLVSRIIWKMFTGEEPQIVEHISNSHVNRISNLRAATYSENLTYRHRFYQSIRTRAKFLEYEQSATRSDAWHSSTTQQQQLP